MIYSMEVYRFWKVCPGALIHVACTVTPVDLKWPWCVLCTSLSHVFHWQICVHASARSFTGKEGIYSVCAVHPFVPYAQMSHGKVCVQPWQQPSTQREERSTASKAKGNYCDSCATVTVTVSLSLSLLFFSFQICTPLQLQRVDLEGVSNNTLLYAQTNGVR